MPPANGPASGPLGGLLSQVELCLVCTRCSERVNESTYTLREVEHACPREILLARARKAKKQEEWRKVGRRPDFPRPARYEVCRYYSPRDGCRKHRNQCTFARSPEEALVWTFEREHNVKRLWLKAEVAGAQSQAARAPARASGTGEEIRTEFGGRFQEVCKPCFYQRPARIFAVGPGEQCPEHKTRLPVLVHVTGESRKKRRYTEIRPLPKAGQQLDFCMYVSRGQPCRHGASRCHYAHSDVEMAVWEAERARRLVRSALLRPEGTAAPEAAGDPKAAHGAGGGPVTGPKVQLYCPACLVTCSSQENFENHCATLEHTQMVSYDQVPQWRHRAPPFGLTKFKLCSRPDICVYGTGCTQAHSPEELQEWIQRAQATRTKAESARQDGLLSYSDRLIFDYQHCSNEVLVISEKVENVVVLCKQPLRVHSEDRRLKYKWTFIISSMDPLLHVALLKRLTGATFSLVAEGLQRGVSYAQGERFHVPGTALTSQVEVRMDCVTFGAYEQWVVFDFGHRPVLLQKLQVTVGRRDSPSPQAPPRDEGRFVDLARWHGGNRHIIPSVKRSSDDLQLLAKYKVPALALEFRPGGLAQGPATRFNYREKMHHFLYLEEETQQRLVAKLNLQVTVSLMSMLQTLAVGMKFAPPGELYAEVPIPCALTPDTDQGYLLSRAVNTAYLAPVPAPDNLVYEVCVEGKATSERSVWLQLPARCCAKMDLRAGTTSQVEVQFQIDRLLFRRWHQAVDTLMDERLVVPDVPACSLPRLKPPPATLNGNRKQKLAISFITGEAAGIRQVPPLLIYGPFGTGKTYTLAMATLEIIKQPQTKVLICTHTNSAADIYIREYFHAHVTDGHPEAVPLRVIPSDRSISQTDPITLQYCCLAENQLCFRQPSPAELDQHRVIISTTTHSRDLRVPAGYFSHILIDEAAQMLECEALIPLAYANLDTRVVLAGDHMQVTPKLFSVGNGQSADHTLLNRLFQYYQREKHEVAVQSRVIFHENYRSTEGIVSFVSRHFYVVKGNAIQASGRIPPHPEMYPLAFCHVAGTPERDMSMTSWFNAAEILQVIEKVQEVYRTWPCEWGTPEFKRICVVSHGMQVNVIRQELRKKYLGEVAVENFENLPGREFRVIIVSTVHNRDSLLSTSAPNLEFFSEARVLNTVMTRAQSQVIAVGDAVALCSFGQCSRVWKHFIQECIEKGSVSPEGLTLEQIKQDVADKQRWARGPGEQAEEQEDEDDSDAVSWSSDAELNTDDPILRELLDESKNVAVTVTEDGLLDVKAGTSSRLSGRQEYVSFPASTLNRYLRMHPKMYKRCELVKEAFEKASAFSLDDSPPLNIQIKGRVNCGTAFTGDRVLVELLSPGSEDGASPRPHGRVVGVLEKAERARTFICKMDEFDHRVMIPIDPSVTKIFVPVVKAKPHLVPIRRFSRGKIQLVSYERITEETKRNQLFHVQIISWRERFYYPLGIILEILPLALTLDQGLKILDMEYCLAPGQKYPAPVTKEVAKFQSGKAAVPLGPRQDFRPYLTFTVDPRGSRDLDDAISVRDLGGHYEIGIHIADVASFVPQDGALDREAKKRGATYYAPSREPVGMLPPQLSQDFCSLLPQRDRQAVSLLLTVEKSGDRLAKQDLASSVIRSDRQLSYEEAEALIKGRPGDAPLRFDTLEDCVFVAYHFSHVSRRARLQGDCYYEQLDEENSLGNRGSHQMIQEYMITFNSFVAEFLTNKENTRNITPLRCQARPNPQQAGQLRNKYSHLLPMSIHLSHHLRAPAGGPAPAAGPGFGLLTPLWEHLQLAARARDYHKMVDLIATDDVHPQLAPASLEFRKLLSRSYFSRSNSTALAQVGHYSLQVDWYTWASSPIRRYIDLVLQRQLLAALGWAPLGYSSDDIDFLCHDFNRKNGRALAYERRAHSLQLATQLKGQVLQKLAFVVGVEPENRFFKVVFPMNRDTLPDPHLIYYRALQLVEQPAFASGDRGIRLMWKRRVYSAETGKECAPLPGRLLDDQTTPVSPSVWTDVLSAVRAEEFGRAASLLQGKQAPPPRTVGLVARSKCFHYLELALELCAGDALTMQLTADVQRGFLVPSIQLWSLTPGFAVCLEHAEKPVDCFTRYATQATRDAYKDAREYSRVWDPLCAMESATSAVAENDPIVLRDVWIAWERKRNRQGQLQGTFSLEDDFLEACAIDVNFSSCYLCVRLEGLKLGTPSEEEEEEEEGGLSGRLRELSLSGGAAAAATAAPTADSGLRIDPDTYTWVAHGQTEETDGDESKADRRERKYKVQFYLNHVSMEHMPPEVTRPRAKFTIELIPKLLPDVRREEAIWKLQWSSSLVTSIALGQPLQEAVTKSSLLKQKIFDVPRGQHRLNKSQNRAVLEALQKPFTLIQGPPGTGKTVVGVHIVYWFHQLNQEKQQDWQPLEGEKKKKETKEKCILYCGPSNKSVDVVAEILLRMRGSLRPLRVYSEQVEAMEFPPPGSCRNLSRKHIREGKPKPELREIILHHRIRLPSNPCFHELIEFDKRVKKGDLFTSNEIEIFKTVLSKAKSYELSRHDVILCTCSCAASNILTKLNTKQILIDECSMSTEPETLIPLVNHSRAEKVVLLGDHKQLRPVVNNDACRSLGMEKSLFERYQSQALMLDTQYRMHKDICRFPSKEFYNNRLQTCPDLKWPPSVFFHKEKACCPIIFGYIEGKEQSLLVSTDEGNENSRANLEEVEQVVRIAKQLTLDGTIKPKNIAILSPYNAQVAEINKRLLKEGMVGVTVSSIMKSQGSEWKYVILSIVRSCPRSDIDRKPTKSWLKKHLGFVTDPNQVNVGITRAQEGLCIIGNHCLLKCCPLWKRLLDFYHQEGCCVPAPNVCVRKRPAFLP
ncbi:helicase with zinc finger domain 2 [Tachyglossus aculeatus]|uniref:helicase with zinc finger domain 2 n=1 Tax=Tachyglossus aculeatus TaxID=9261 RepID=UPI0018F6C8F2|nr:helicase with zinc finger domain 2 [Tachyglossus aculeatus]